jgi:hypothetical protein
LKQQSRTNPAGDQLTDSDRLDQDNHLDSDRGALGAVASPLMRMVVVPSAVPTNTKPLAIAYLSSMLVDFPVLAMAQSGLLNSEARHISDRIYG